MDLNFTGYHDNRKLANDIGKFFVQKIERIRTELDTAATADPSQSFEPPYLNSAQLASFTILSQENVKNFIGKSSKKTCSLDPMPTPLVVECLDPLLPVITRMINLSLQCGTFPDDWKLADVKPRLKKTGAEALFTNLRPISNLSFASKLTERAVFAQIHDHLITNKLYPKAQSAYREYHSTETALLRVKNDILLNMNQQRVTLLVLLDLSAAFDTVDHTILLNRLSKDFGITGNVYSWFESYLHNRFQSVSINCVTSDKFHTKHGVPQGSRSSNVIYPMCTPTLTIRSCIYLSGLIPELSSRPLYRLCKCIADIRQWMLQERQRLNDDKTEFIIIGTGQQLAKVNIDSLRVGESSTAPTSKVKNLGCWFDGQLKMDTQINSICKTAFFHLYNIRRIRKFLNFECTKILVNAFVTSRLDFCNSLLYGLPKSQLHKLQRVQNAAARLTCNVGRFEHITPSLYMLHWLPVNYRIQFKILLFVYKALNGIAPPYISELVELKPASRYNLRNSDDTPLLNSPSLKSRITLGDRSFKYAGPKLWNELPRDIRHANTVHSFKRLLKTHLFRKAFLP